MSVTDSTQARHALLEKYRRGQIPRVEAIERIPRRAGDVVPLSSGQQQFWLLSQLLPDVPAYNECVTLSLPGPLNVAALERSFNELLKRHEAWRTSFPLIDGQPVQQIHPVLSLSLPVIDLRHLPLAEREAEARRLATAEALLPFDLANGPLLRASLMRLDDEDHRLFLCLHHIIFDGVTIYQLFLPQLRSLYEAFSREQTALSLLPDHSIQYADYAIWQRERLQGDILTKQLDYWKKQLAGAATTLELPSDRPRPPVPSHRGAFRQFALSPNLTESLKALSHREGVTLFMTLLAAFNTLLYRYTAQEDILVGTASAGRNHPDTRHVMGVFINMLVLRTDLQGNPCFRDLLHRVREVTLEAQAHQDVPFEHIVRELQPERENGQNPFFQALLMLEPTPPAHPSGWTITHLDINTGTSKFDLSLILEERPESLLGRFDYSTDLFDDATIERMVGHWQTLLAGIVSHPEQRLSDLPLLTEQERHRLLVAWNSTSAPYPATTCVHQLFEQQVERDPAAIALVFEQQHMSYQELNRRANQLAHCLQAMGVGPEVMVGVCVERSIDLIVALLGIFKAGGVYVPLDSDYPQERLAFLMQDTNMPVLLTQEHLLSRLPPHNLQVLCLDRDRHRIEQYSSLNPESEVTSDQLAYVIYTSGSTGLPKGVLIEHGPLAAHCCSMAQVYELSPQDRVLQFSVHSFDVSLEQILPTLLVGARLVLRGPEIWSPRQLFQQLKEQQLSVMSLTSAYWHQVIQGWQQVSSEEWGTNSLRLMIVGGDQFPLETLRLWRQMPLDTVRLLNAYGPTETVITATLYDTVHYVDDPTSLHSVPIGRPLPNRRVYVLDRAGQPVPAGIVGELYIGGQLLARGYLNRAEMTAERFLPDPFSEQPRAQFYKTGDLVRYLPDGSLQFVGRVDQQVKLRGFRIEVGEIEASLQQHPLVRDVAVVVREDNGDKLLVAYVVASREQEQELNGELLRSYLKEKLPAYMLPAAFVFLEELPLTTSGKLDRRALPKPGEKDTGESYIAPTLRLHHQLVRIWEDLLDVHPIGMRDNFFSLGGHSLLAVQMVDRIEQVCGKRIALSTLYVDATIEHLAETLLQEDDAEKMRDETRAEVVLVQPGKRGTRPFFFLHGEWLGGGFYCFNLARYLDADRPFYILEPYDFDRQQIPPSFEEMAAKYIEALRAIQPEGPYLLGGFCNGALFAYEMARQLHVVGQQVELLFMIDPADPSPHLRLRKVLNRLGTVLHLNQNIQFNWFLRYLYLRRPSYRSKVQATAQKAMQQAGQKPSPLLKLLKLDKLIPSPVALRYHWSGIYHWVGAAYTPGPYSGECMLLWSSEAYSYAHTHEIDWHAISGSEKVEEDVFPGTHLSCEHENLPVLAEHLNLYLRRVSGNTGKP